ncbi:MAG: SBBP repeat-containing protein [Acidobacteria bacterium]|nr:SBBP repeat-containing protein [Acidobacteriota bacterium]
MFHRSRVSLWAAGLLCVIPALAASPKASDVLSGLPLHFERHGAAIVARVPGYQLSLDGAGAQVAFRKGTVRMRLHGASGIAPQAVDRMSGVSNYIQGSDPRRWRTSVTHFARARYTSVYPGVNLDFYGNARNIEYDFLIAPGADPRRIAMTVEGAQSVTVTPAGEVAVRAFGEELLLKAPVAYQRRGSERAAVAARFRVAGNRVSFDLGAYDRRRELVIDPVITFATYLGGAETEVATGIALDAQSNIYVTGYTNSQRFPIVGQPLSANNAGADDAFIVKVNSTGNQLLYSTYLGGTENDRPLGIVIDGLGNAVIAGNSSSEDFPMAGTVFQGLGSGVFLARLSANGSSLLASTFLGGIESVGIGFLSAMAGDANGNVYLAGYTSADDFLVTAGSLQPLKRSGTDAFLTKVSSDLSRVVYSTYLGGDGTDQARAVTVDSAGNAFVAGSTNSVNFPRTTGTYATPNGGNSDVFVTRVNAAGAAIDFSAILGGLLDDSPTAITLGPTGNIFVAGTTLSSNYPTTPGVFQVLRPTFATPGFVSKLDSTATLLLFSTYLGAVNSYYDVRNIASIRADAGDNLYAAVTGFGTGFPTTTGALQSPAPGFQDGLLVRLSPGGDVLGYSTFIGGSADDSLNAMALDQVGNLYLAGGTSSSNFPGTSTGYQPLSAGNGDAFVVKINIGAVTTSCTYALSAVTFSIDANGGAGTVDLTTDSTCAWTVTASQSWLTIASATTGTGSTTVSFNVAVNTTLANRSASLSLGGKTFTVSQLAAPCSYTIDPGNRSVPAGGGSVSFLVTTLPSCTWTSVSNSTWLQSLISGTQTGTGQVPVNFADNVTGIPRTGSLTIAKQWVQLIQPAAAPATAFDDVPLSNSFADHIFLMKYNGVADFCNSPATFCPDGLTTRATMSQYIIRALSGGDNFTYTSTPFFTDVPPEHPYFSYIQKMRDLGITVGCSATQYCPNNSVTRSEMAAFIVRARLRIRSGQTFTYITSGFFTDVLSTDVFFPFVQKMKELGITSGCSTTSYCPNDWTSRGQMAVFIIRALFTP